MIKHWINSKESRKKKKAEKRKMATKTRKDKQKTLWWWYRGVIWDKVEETTVARLYIVDNILDSC